MSTPAPVDGKRTLVVGVSGSGKTVLCKRIAAHLFRCGRPVVVFDPFFQPGKWEADIITDSVEMLYNISQHPKNRNMVFLIDEAGEFFERDRKYNRIATLTRQKGHDVFFVAQRALQLQPAVRSNCNEMYVFRQSVTDSKILAVETACDNLLQASNLQKLEYLHFSNFSKITLNRLQF